MEGPRRSVPSLDELAMLLRDGRRPPAARRPAAAGDGYLAAASEAEEPSRIDLADDNAAPFPGRAVAIEGRAGELEGLYYRPQGAAAGCLLLLPGSGGGLGPGLDNSPCKLPLVRASVGRGALYPRLGCEASSGGRWSWSYAPEDDGGGGGAGFGKLRLAVLQVAWRTTPRWNLYRHDVLQSAVDDVVAAVRWLGATHPGLPVVAVGHSFGGPALWAAIQKREVRKAVVGVASLASSCRGGGRYSALKMTTAGGVAALGSGKRPMPALFMHGTADDLVDYRIAEHLVAQATGPCKFVTVGGAAHTFNGHRDAAYRRLQEWIVRVFVPSSNRAALHGPEYLGPSVPPVVPKKCRAARKHCHDPAHPLVAMLGYTE